MKARRDSILSLAAGASPLFEFLSAIYMEIGCNRK